MREKKVAVKEIAPFMIELAEALAAHATVLAPETEEEVNACLRVAKAMAELSLFMWDDVKVKDPRFPQMKQWLETFVKSDL